MTRKQALVKRAKREYHFAKQAEQTADPEPGAVQEATIDIVTIDHGRVVNIVHVIARRANIAVPLCDALLGEAHPVKYRMATGVVIMAVGVTIAKTMGHGPHLLIAGIADAIGYGLHGLGLVPFIDHLAEKFRHGAAKK